MLWLATRVTIIHPSLATRRPLQLRTTLVDREVLRCPFLGRQILSATNMTTSYPPGSHLNH